jgi:hypothetical protein
LGLLCYINEDAAKYARNVGSVMRLKELRVGRDGKVKIIGRKWNGIIDLWDEGWTRGHCKEKLKAGG